MAIFKWLLKATALVLVAGLVLYAGVILLAFWGERDRPFKGRLLEARTTLQVLDSAVTMFYERQHRLPVSLDEVVDTSLLGDEGRLLTDPWGGKYFYEVSNTAGQQTYQIWSVPDAATQAKIGVARLTLQSDWEGWVP